MTACGTHRRRSLDKAQREKKTIGKRVMTTCGTYRTRSLDEEHREEKTGSECGDSCLPDSWRCHILRRRRRNEWDLAATLVSELGTLLEPSDALQWWFGHARELAYKSLSYLTVCIANINLHINVADSA